MANDTVNDAAAPEQLDPRSLLGNLTRAYLGNPYWAKFLTPEENVPNPPLLLSIDPTYLDTPPPAFYHDFMISIYQGLVNQQYIADLAVVQRGAMIIEIYSKYAPYYLNQNLQSLANAAGFSITYNGIVYNPVVKEEKK